MKARRVGSVFEDHERHIAADERNGVVHRWRYGQDARKYKVGRERLPKGFINDRIRAAERIGLKITAREIQYRIALAEAYPTEAHTRTAVRLSGSWTALREAGFPAVVPDPDLLDELAAQEAAAALDDEYEQLSLIPGLAPVLKLAGRKVPLAVATVADAISYRDMYRQIHNNYGKRLALIEVAVDAMLAGSGGDQTANAVESWQRGADDATHPLRVVAA